MGEKLRRVRVSWEVIVELLKSREFVDVEYGCQVKVTGLPGDATLARLLVRDRRFVELTVRSEEFSPVDDDEEPPLMDVKCESTRLPG